MKLLSPEIIDVLVQIYADERYDKLQTFEATDHCSKQWMTKITESAVKAYATEFRRCPIFQLSHSSSCEKPLYCLALTCSVEYHRTRWNGYWQGEKVQFLVPECLDSSNGFPQPSARIVADLIAEEYGFKILKENVLTDEAGEFELPRIKFDTKTCGINPLIETSTTTYWLKHEIRGYYEERVRELQVKGAEFLSSLIDIGFPRGVPLSNNSSGGPCIICGGRAWIEWRVCSERSAGTIFQYSAHQGLCQKILFNAVEQYQLTARRALDKLKNMGVSNGKTKISRRKVCR